MLSVPILLYHEIVESTTNHPKPGLVVSLSRFQLQMLILRMFGYHTVGLKDLARALDGKMDATRLRRSVIITFDDGYIGIYDRAFPALFRHGFTAAVYLIAQDFTARRQEGLRAFPILNPSQVSELVRNGYEIGSHTLTHPHLPQLPPNELADELVLSKNVLEQTFKVQVESLAYPYGEYNSDVERLVAESGYECAITTRIGRFHSPSDRFSLKRIPVGSAQRLMHFIYRLFWARHDSDKEDSSC